MAAPSNALYRILLLLLPRDRRRQHGDQMTSAFADLRRQAWREGGLSALASLWMREIAGLVRFAVRERTQRPAPADSRGRDGRLSAAVTTLRHAVRGLGRQPGLAAAAIVIIGLGVGVTTAVFAVVNGTLLRPLPFPDADRLVDLWESRQDGFQPHATITEFEAVQWHDRAQGFIALAAYRYLPLTLTGNGPAVRLIGLEASGDFFRTLGRAPLAGRLLTDADERARADVAVLREGVWRSRFGSDPAIIGGRLDLDGRPRTIVGVVADDAAFPSNVDVWIPLQSDPAHPAAGRHTLSAIARLAPGRTLTQARSELTRLAADLEREHPESNRGHGAGVDPLIDTIVGTVRPALRVLLVTALIVLLSATANVSGLLIARSLARRREFAVRRALGASGAALAGQLAAEGVALAVPGGALGLLVAAWALHSVLNPVAWLLPRADAIRLDGRTIAFAFAVTLVAGLGAQVVPLLRARRGTTGDLGARQSTPDPRAVVVRHGIVAGQIALAFALLCGALLLVKTLLDLSRVNPGFSLANTVTFNMQPSITRYGDPARQIEFVDRALEAISAVPGVAAAGIASDLPFSGSRSTTSFEVFGLPAAPGQTRAADLEIATPGYFSAMGIGLIDGRDFTNADRGGGVPVAIVNRALAARLWPGERAIGQRLRIGHHEEVQVFGSPVWREVVGVIGDIRHDDLRSDANGQVYVPFAQSPTRRLGFAVRASASPDAIVAAVRDRLAGVAPAEAMYSVRTMEDRVGRSIATPRLIAILTTLFAAASMLLAAVGLHATLSYAVGQRSHEFGIRLALGAKPAQVLGLVWRETAWVIGFGLAAGAALGWLLAHWLASSLFGVRPGDPVTLLVSAIAVGVVGAMAAVRPARRALRIDPVGLLRGD